nr:MAG TPA: hypothetical protein [Caudoviricetes sp.]
MGVGVLLDHKASVLIKNRDYKKIFAFHQLKI